jgi:16S rRNA (cytosine1402-N4)-methyltransferase
VSAIAYHTPVLATEVARLAEGARRAVDATVGGGGHAASLVAAGAAVLAFDRDPDAIQETRRRLGPAVELHVGRFGDPQVAGRIQAFHPDFILLDLGVSSRQLDESGRGFTFRRGAPLDMRMDPSADVTAADLLNAAPEPELARVFREYGDGRHAHRLARAIVRRRTRARFTTSDHFVNAIRETLGSQAGPADFARLFQAVRIAVNHEVEELRTALPTLRDALVDGGVLAVISYHSGEDRIVKRAFQEWARPCVCPPSAPVCRCRGRPLGAAVFRRPIRPAADETAANPRARSARLRAFRTHAGT